MHHIQLSNKQALEMFLGACEHIIKNRQMNLTADVFFQKHPQSLKNMLLVYNQLLTRQGKLFAYNNLEETLLSITKDVFEQINDCEDQTNKRQLSQIQLIVVKKEKEQESDLRKINQYKDARSKFFAYQLPSKINEANIVGKNRQKILQLFVNFEEYVDIENVKPMLPYRELIKQLRESLLKIKQYQKKIKECLPLTFIKQRKITSLKIIHIEYDLKMDKCDLSYRYQCSAFELFKVIQENRMLTSATFKGILVNDFEQFLQIINLDNKQLQKQREKQNWIRDFFPMKQLKLTINSNLRFNLQRLQVTSSHINDLIYFQELFKELNQITASITLGSYNQVHNWATSLDILWRSLRKIKQVKINIQGETKLNKQSQKYPIYIYRDNAWIVRCLLFAELACFSEITQLSFKYISLGYDININDILAMQQNLNFIIKNNRIVYLGLESCHNFTFISSLTTIQSIYLSNTSVHKQKNIKSEIHRTNPNLKYIKYYEQSENPQNWAIDEQLFNKVQALFIKFDKGVSLHNISLQSPSKIKYLSIYQSSFAKADGLSIFPKLTSLTYLSLSCINFDKEFLRTIPSVHLQSLQIRSNNKIKDDGLIYIDQRWPNLQSLTLKNCKKLTENVWKICQFKGLITLEIDSNVLSKGNNLYYLKSKGINIPSKLFIYVSS